MALFLDIHPENPQSRLITKVTETLKSGAVIAYPTDSGYALGCALGNKNAMQRIIKIRQLKRHHHFTLMLKDLSHVGEYAKLNNSGFRLLKKILPGAYTFILEGTKDIPNRLLNGNENTFIYPNPSAGTINIETVNTSTSSIKIYNTIGELVFSNDDLTSNAQIHLDQPPGIYFVVVKTSNSTSTSKVILR